MVRQVLTESAVLAGAGVVVGIACRAHDVSHAQVANAATMTSIERQRADALNERFME
jgi:hypothetical protein